jgi:hypothetical protein
MALAARPGIRQSDEPLWLYGRSTHHRLHSLRGYRARLTDTLANPAVTVTRSVMSRL